MKKPTLPPRLLTVAKMIKTDNLHKEKILADVGTDHAKLPIYTALSGFVKKAYASDINEGPIKKAKENILLYLGNSADKVTPILGDGTENIPNDYNYLSITGMGGDLIINILKNSNAKNDTVFIFSPHTNSEKLRKYLYENGYLITEENLVKEEDKLYTVIKSVKTDKKTEYEELDIYFSKALIKSKNVFLKEYIKKHINSLDKGISGREVSKKNYTDTENLKNLREKMKILEESL